MTSELRKHIAILLTFFLSSTVVFTFASKDLRYLRASQSGNNLETRSEDVDEKDSAIETKINEITGNKPDSETPDSDATSSPTIDTAEFSAGDISRTEIFNENVKNIDKYLAENNIGNEYGIVYIDLKYPGNTYYHNADTVFKPASIYKVPLAMVSLKNVEAGKYTLDDVVWHEGKQKTVREVIDVMIKESNNDSMGILENLNGGYNATQEQIKNELGINAQRIGQITTPQDVAKAMEILYKQPENKYLSEKHNQYLIDLMLNAESYNRDRIPAAVNKFNEQNKTTLKAATKIGNLDGIYQDAGIIYGENSDYILVTMNRNKLTYAEAVGEIEQITLTLLNGME